MEDEVIFNAGPKDRIYLRIPVRIEAVIFTDNHPYAKVTISDLSTTGLSVSTPIEAKIPDSCDIIFRLPGRFRRIKVGLEVKNRLGKEGNYRIGCRFREISSKDQKAISDYIRGCTEFHPACLMFSIAAFLLFLDAAARIFTWIVSIYYREAHVEYAFSTFGWFVYELSLIFYASCAFMACIYSCDIRKKRFMLSLYCGALAFLFILTKYIFYCKLHLWSSAHMPIKIFFWAESLIIAYTIYAAFFFIASLKTITFIAKTIDNYQKAFREEKAV